MPAGTWPLVGRDEELGLLEDLVTRPDAGGVVIAGATGTGKTRLALEAANSAERAGRPTERVIATRAAASIPLGAFAQLLPPMDGRAATVELLQVGAEALTSRAGTKRLVLLVDDAHLLDEASATMLSQVVLAGRVFAVLTMRSDEPAPDALAALWKEGLTDRLELQDLGLDETAALLHAALEGEIDPATAHELWELSAGNPLFLRELVLGALDAAVLDRTSGVWALGDRLVSPPSLREIVRGRVADIPEDAHDALSTIALAESVGFDDVEALHGHDPLELLERHGLVEVVTSDRRRSVRLSHPLYGEVLRAELPATVARRIAGALAVRLRDVGTRRREDVLRLVTLQLAAGLAPDPDQLRQAAVHAYQAGDFATAERLARMASPDDHRARLLLVQVLDESGRQEAAEEVLALLSSAELEPAVGARAALLRSDVLFFGLGREAQALEVLARAREDLSGRIEVGELVANRGWIELHAGRPQAALTTVADLHRSEDPLVAAAGAIVASRALGLVGRTVEALEVADRGITAMNAHGPPMANRHSDFPSLVRGYALLFGGSLAAAEAVALRGLEGAIARRPSFLHAHWLSLLGSTREAQGQLASAAGHFRQAAALERRLGQPGLLRWNLAGLAVATAQGGAPDEAEAALAEHDRLGDRPERMLACEAARARGWILAARGQHSDALTEMAAAADLARAFNAVALEATCLHDRARLGDAGSVAGRLEALGDDSPLTAACLRHVTGLAEASQQDLVAAASAFEKLGALLLAAEAYADAAREDRRSGRAREAQRHRVRSNELTARCEGARTPALALDDEVSPLTRREREVVAMAASGLKSREIADRLVVSVRTVDNLLHRAYVKLGVSSRLEAGHAIGARIRPSSERERERRPKP